MMSRASARAIKDHHDRVYFAATKGGWSLPPDGGRKDVVHVQDQAKDQTQRPTTGRNTKLGRKVEKPRDPMSGGPSGQKDRAKHDKRHANK
jgi:hypothetical protein